MFFAKFVTFRIISFATLGLPLIACGPYRESNDSRPKPEESEIHDEQTLTPYIGATIFEGGILLPKNRKPLWRLYICLENAAGIQSGDIDLDLEKLSASLNRPVANGTATLSKLTLHYTYETTSELLSFSSRSTQPWTMVSESAPTPLPVSSIFNFSWDQSEIETHEEIYRSQNLNYYVTSRLSTRDYLHDPTHLHIVNACRLHNSPYFFQLRSAISRF